jgi:hypothetical protein
VEETSNVPATEDPSSFAAWLSGDFFGIPNWLWGGVLLILFLWAARHPVRRVLWQVFFITGRVFGRWGFWLKEHGQAARANCNEKIASHRAEELQDRMLVLEDRIGHRAEKLPKETGPIIARLDTSTHQLATIANAIADINVEDAAERAFRAALPSMEQGRGLSKMEKNIALNTARVMNERLTPIRPALTTLKTEGPRLREVAEKLTKIDQRFNQGVDQVNKAFSEFELILKSEDRTKIASRASIVIPWLLGILITGIALSGVFLNFFLIERPMAEIVGEGARIAGVGLPTFAAMIVIFLEFVAGIVLMDAAGFTRLIPAFHSMSDGGRRIMFGVAFSFLLAFSILEMTLSIVREQIIEQQQETRDLANRALVSPTLAAPQAPAAAPDAAAPAVAEEATPSRNDPRNEGLALSTIAQLILAALIPWLLAAAALSLETIVRNSVFMVSIAGSYVLLFLAFFFKTISVLFKNVGLFVLSIYDLVIFAPLWVERRFNGKGESRRSQDRRERKERKKEATGEEDDFITLTDEQPKRERERKRA